MAPTDHEHDRALGAFAASQAHDAIVERLADHHEQRGDERGAPRRAV